MHYHIILTESCNSQCKYCYEKSIKDVDNNLDNKFNFIITKNDSQIDLDRLSTFLKKDPNPILIFYGGEPLLKIDKIKEIIDKLKHTSVEFKMQTNGKLLDEIPIEYLKKIDKILVSIDGDKKRTDFNRGNGTYDKVLSNIKKIREEGYSGEIIARMTLSPLMNGGEDSWDIYNQVLHLTQFFTSIHWQLDLGFYSFDFNKDNLEEWSKKYNESLDELVSWWMSHKQIKLYPFIGILDAIKFGSFNGKIMCGAGHSGYAINTVGDIVACPIMGTIKDFKCGDLDTPPSALRKIEIDECNSCEYKKYCGGRCLYWRKSKLWPKEGDAMICNLIKHLVNELKKYSNKVSKEDLFYEKYFGPEIIP